MFVYAVILRIVVALFVALCWAQAQEAPEPAAAAPSPEQETTHSFLGTFTDGRVALTLESSPTGGAPPGVRSYVGTLSQEKQHYPVRASSRDGAELTGQFESGGHAFDFTATLADDALTLTTGGVSYVLARAVDVPSPFDDGLPDAPEDEGAPAGLCDLPVDELPGGIATAFSESFENTDPQQVLGGILTVGRDADGHWTATLTGSSYRLVNEIDPTAVRFFYLLSLPGDTDRPLSQGTTTVEVSVKAETEIAGAGILYGFEPTTRYYYALVLTEGGYAFYRRDGDGLNAMLSVQSEAVRVGESNRLAIRGEGGDMRLFLNDVSLACMGTTTPIEGGIGIIAIGTGTFDIESFSYAAP